MARTTLFGNDVGQVFLCETKDKVRSDNSFLPAIEFRPLTIFPLARRRVPIRRLMNFLARLSWRERCTKAGESVNVTTFEENNGRDARDAKQAKQAARLMRSKRVRAAPFARPL